MDETPVITFWEQFASAEMEERFRRESFGHDLRLSRFLLPVFAAAVVMFLVHDWRFRAVTPSFSILIGGRVAILLASASFPAFSPSYHTRGT